MKQKMTPMQASARIILNILIVWPAKLIIYLITKLVKYIRDRRYYVDMEDYPDDEDWIDDEDNEQQIHDELHKYDNLPEIPEMCQIFPIDDNTCIGVQYVSMCPDETAHIRIIGDTTFSQLYKRKVYREKSYGHERYFKLNNEKYYLRPTTTQPIDPTQAKEGK